MQMEREVLQCLSCPWVGHCAMICGGGGSTLLGEGIVTSSFKKQLRSELNVFIIQLHSLSILFLDF